MKRNNRLLFWICYGAYMVNYIARVNLTIAAPALRGASILTTAQVGLMGGVFSVVYAIGRLLSGVIGDHAAPWKLLCGGLALAGTANLLIGAFPPFLCILLLWALNALAQSMLWSPILRLIAARYAPAEAKRKAALMVTAVASGNICGILLSAFLISRLSAAWGFLVPGALALVFCGLCYCAAHNIDLRTKTAQHPVSWKSSFSILSRKPVRRMLLPAMMHGIIKDNVSLWMGIYLVDRFDLHLETTAWYVLLIPAAGLAGRLLYTVLYRLLGERENAVSAFGALLGAAASAILCFGARNAWTAVLCMSAAYAAVSLINTTLLSTFPMHFSEEGIVSSVSGMMDFATYGGAGIGSFLFSWLVSAAGYQTMFLVWCAASAACLLCFCAGDGMKRAQR